MAVFDHFVGFAGFAVYADRLLWAESGAVLAAYAGIGDIKAAVLVCTYGSGRANVPAETAFYAVSLVYFKRKYFFEKPPRFLPAGQVVEKSRPGREGLFPAAFSREQLPREVGGLNGSFFYDILVGKRCGIEVFAVI